MSRQNVYDDSRFFRRYQQMRDSRTGINEAIEQPAIRALVPPVSGARVVDLGCGDGQLSRELAMAGAESVLGIDPSEKMLSLARERTTDERVRYMQAFAEDVQLPAASTDLVVSSLAIHYVDDFDKLMVRVAEWLAPGGDFVASMEHPILTASPESGSAQSVVDNYGSEGRRETSWNIDGVTKYHRQVSTIVNAVTNAGLIIRHLGEPVPTSEALEQRPELEIHRRRPAILTLAAIKPDTQVPGNARDF